MKYGIISEAGGMWQVNGWCNGKVAVQNIETRVVEEYTEEEVYALVSGGMTIVGACIGSSGVVCDARYIRKCRCCDGGDISRLAVSGKLSGDWRECFTGVRNAGPSCFDLTGLDVKIVRPNAGVTVIIDGQTRWCDGDYPGTIIYNGAPPESVIRYWLEHPNDVMRNSVFNAGVRKYKRGG